MKKALSLRTLAVAVIGVVPNLALGQSIQGSTYFFNGSVDVAGSVQSYGTSGGASYVVRGPSGQKYGMTTDGVAGLWLGRTAGPGAGVSSDIFINMQGFVGVGTASPIANLDVAGSVQSYGASGGASYVVRGPSGQKYGLATDGVAGLWLGRTAGPGAGVSNDIFINTQGNVGIGTAAPTASLDLSQKRDALALPIGGDAERPAGSSLKNGEIRFNSQRNYLEAYINGAWVNIAAPAAPSGVLCTHAICDGRGGAISGADCPPSCSSPRNNAMSCTVVSSSGQSCSGGAAICANAVAAGTGSCCSGCP